MFRQFWLWVSHKTPVRCQLDCSGNSIYNVVYPHGWQVGAGCWWKYSVGFSPAGVSIMWLICCHSRMPGSPQSKQSKRVRQQLSIFGSHTISLPSHSLRHSSALIQRGTDPPKARISESWDCGKPSCRLATTSIHTMTKLSADARENNARQWHPSESHFTTWG